MNHPNWNNSLNSLVDCPVERSNMFSAFTHWRKNTLNYEKDLDLIYDILPRSLYSFLVNSNDNNISGSNVPFWLVIFYNSAKDAFVCENLLEMDFLLGRLGLRNYSVNLRVVWCVSCHDEEICLIDSAIRRTSETTCQRQASEERSVALFAFRQAWVVTVLYLAISYPDGVLRLKFSFIARALVLNCTNYMPSGILISIFKQSVYQKRKHNCLFILRKYVLKYWESWMYYVLIHHQWFRWSV